MRSRTETPESEPSTYVDRVNRAIDFIVESIGNNAGAATPDARITLARVADVAGFSEFHFHRIFRSLVGETLGQFIKRLRLERALTLMSRSPGRALTDVALEVGFTSSSDFSRSFKQRYGVAPSAFDLTAFRDKRRQDMIDATFGESTEHRLQRLPKGENPDGFEVEIVSLPARQVAYVRVLDPYGPEAVPAATERFITWARERGLEGGQWLGYMWDDPEIVAHSDCRYDVGLVVPEGTQRSGEVGMIEFPPMQVAHVEVRGSIEMEMRAIDWVFQEWLPSSGYSPTSHPSFESWIGLPYAHGFTHFEIDMQLPIARF